MEASILNGCETKVWVNAYHQYALNSKWNSAPIVLLELRYLTVD